MTINQTATDGVSQLHLESTTYQTLKIRITQSGRAIALVWEGTNQAKAKAIFEFLTTQPEIVWMHLKRDGRTH